MEVLDANSALNNLILHKLPSSSTSDITDTMTTCSNCELKPRPNFSTIGQIYFPYYLYKIKLKASDVYINHDMHLLNRLYSHFLIVNAILNVCSKWFHIAHAKVTTKMFTK